MLLIVKLQLKALGKLLEEQDMDFVVTEAAQKEIVRSGFDPVFGARPLRRAIQKLVENPISSLIIEKKAQPGDTILVDFDGDNLLFNVERMEFMEPEGAKKPVKKTFTCDICNNQFTTDVIPHATPICSKCASTKLKEVSMNTEEKKIDAADNKDSDNKKPEKEPKPEPPAKIDPPVATQV